MAFEILYLRVFHSLDIRDNDSRPQRRPDLFALRPFQLIEPFPGDPAKLFLYSSNRPGIPCPGVQRDPHYRTPFDFMICAINAT